MRSSPRRTFLVTAVVAAALSVPAARAADATFLNVLTGGTSGVYYPLGVALSQIYGREIPDVRTSVQATKASAENLNLLQSGRGEVAFTLGDALSDAWKGNADAGFPKKLDKLRGIAGLYPNFIHLVARGDAGIRSLADLKGKRVSVGAPKSGTELNSRAILKAAGMTYADLGQVQYLPYAESVELIKNRQLDATLLSSGKGVAAIRDAAATSNVVILSIPASVVAKVGDPAYVPCTIPADTYTGQTKPVDTACVVNFLVTREGLPAELVYRMTKDMFANLPALVAAHGAAKDISRDQALKGMPVPLHPGAERYYKEVGLLK
ncbi:MAG TPA: TAXI family TRAP transporter solute-binding subunit [Anaeromyxobacter sp.]